MNSLQKNRYNAYVTALEYLAENAAITKGVPAIEDACNTARQLMDIVSSIHQDQVGMHGAAISLKKQFREDMTLQAKAIAEAIANYATGQQDAALKEAMLSCADMQQLPDPELALQCRQVLDKARELFIPLQPFGVTKDAVKACEHSLTQFEMLLKNRRNLMAERKYERVKAREVLRQVKRLFEERLDMLLKLFRPKHRMFYRQYLITRALAGHDHLHTRVVGRVWDSTSLEDIANVKVSFKGTSISVLTDQEGFFVLRAPRQVSVVVVFEKEGYKTKTILITIKKGRANGKEVELQRKKNFVK